MTIRSSHRSTHLTAIIGAVGLLSCVAAATATTADSDLPKQVVRYGDLNLESTQGITALYQRVHNAAVQVCRPLDSRELARLTMWKACMDGAVSRATTQINVPAFTAYVSRGTKPIVTARND